MTKKFRNFLLFGSTLGLIATTAITIPLVINHNTTITNNNIVNGDSNSVNNATTDTTNQPNINNNTNPTINTGTTNSSSKLITSALGKKENNDYTSKPNMNGYDKVTRITKNFASGFSNYKVFKFEYSNEDINYDTIGDKAYETQNLYQGVDYYNQRDVMPILSTSYNYSYPNERSQNDVEFDAYHGWNKTNINYYNSSEYDKAYKLTNYSASNVLKETLTEEAKSKLIEMKALTVDFNDSKLKNVGVENINTTLNTLVTKENCNFIIINNASQDKLEELKIPEGTKKLTIKDFDGKLTSLRGILIPNSVEEVEFYSTTARKIDPLVLKSKNHFIYDHISGDNVSRGKLTFNPFNMIDLTSHKNLTNADLQKAINIVYGERQFERNFQGDFSGGYIYQLDLSGTNITSLNNVYVPTQSDGRFNIAYVKWSSSVSNGSITITIGGQQINPGNDGNVNEWYDASGNAEKVKKIILKTETNKTISSDLVLIEVNGLLNKYPNVTTIDIKDVVLSSGQNKEKLAKNLYNNLKAVYTNKGLKVPSDLKVIYNTNQEITSNSLF